MSQEAVETTINESAQVVMGNDIKQIYSADTSLTRFATASSLRLLLLRRPRPPSGGDQVRT